MIHNPVAGSKRPNYGIDGPLVLRNLALTAIGAIGLSFAAHFMRALISPDMTAILIYTGAGLAIFNLACMTLSIWSSKVGKIREASRLLNTYNWQGDEIVLDVGCGRGLMLVAAAKRLSTGKAVGVDIWDPKDQSGNRSENTWENVRMAGVADRVQIKDGDARRLPFDDNIFDIVVSSKALHNIFKRAEREKAINEIARVLKPGGWLAIIDSLKYATTLRQMGWQNAKASNLRFRMFPPVRWTTGTKPASN